MADSIVTLRLRPEICTWNRNYFYVEQQSESVKCLTKFLLQSPALVFFFMGMFHYLALTFRVKELNFYLRRDVQKSFLMCKDKPMEDLHFYVLF